MKVSRICGGGGLGTGTSKEPNINRNISPDSIIDKNTLTNSIIDFILALGLGPDERSDAGLKSKFMQVRTRAEFKEYFGIEFYGDLIYVVGYEYLGSFEPNEHRLNNGVNYILKVGKIDDLLNMRHISTGESQEVLSEISNRIAQIIKKRD